MCLVRFERRITLAPQRNLGKTIVGMTEDAGKDHHSKEYRNTDDVEPR